MNGGACFWGIFVFSWLCWISIRITDCAIAFDPGFEFSPGLKLQISTLYVFIFYDQRGCYLGKGVALSPGFPSPSDPRAAVFGKAVDIIAVKTPKMMNDPSKKANIVI